MKIRAKLILGYLVVALFVGVISYFGIRATRTINRTFARTTEEHLSTIRALESLRYSGLSIVSSTSEFGFIKAENMAARKGEPAKEERGESEEETRQIESAIDVYDRSFTHYEELTKRFPRSGDENLLSNIRTAGQKLQTTSLEIINLKRAEVAGLSVLERREKFEAEERQFIEALDEALSVENSQIAEGIEDVRNAIAAAIKTLIVVGLLTFGIAVISGVGIARAISKPITALRDASTQVSDGMLDVSVDVRSKDELGELAASFNRMTTELKKSRAEIIASRDFVDNIFRSMVDSLIVTDTRLTIQRVNQATLALLGYKERELIGKPIEVVFQEPGSNASWLADLLGNGKISTLEMAVITKSGRKVPISLSGSIIRDEGGKAEGIACVAQDLTERRRAEEERFRLTNHIQLLMNSSGEGIYGIDLQGNCTFINQAAIRMLGYLSEETLGRNMHHLVHHSRPDGSAYPVDQCFIFRAFKNGQECRVDDEVFWRRDGASFPVEYSSFPIFENGVIKGAVVTFVDITQRKSRERELLLANTVLNTEQETSLDGILVVNENQEMVSFNKNFVEMWGLPDDIVQSRSDEKALQSVLDKLESPEAFLRGVKLLYSQKEQKLRDELNLKDGRVFDRYSAPMIGADGNYYGRVFYFRDITQNKLAEQALRESEAVFRSLAETVSAAIYIYRGSKHVYLNPAAEIISGYTHDELMEMDVWDLVHPEFREQIKVRGELRQAGEPIPQRTEIKILTKNGEVRWLDLTASLIQFHGEPAVLATAFDITERKGWEETLRQSEEKYRTILESIQEGYFEVDLAGNLTFFNDPLSRILGTPAGKMMGLNHRAYTDSGTAERICQAFNKVFLTGQPLEDLQYEILTLEGVKRFVESSVLLRRDSAGQIVGFRGTSRDITERRRAEEALKDSEAELRALFEAITDVIIVFDAQGCYRKIVPTNSASMYKPPDDLIGKTQHELFPKDKADFLVDCIGRALKEGRAQRIEYSLPLGGTEVWFDGSVSPLSHDLVIWIARDITERKRAEAALRASEEQYRTLFERNLAGVYRATLEGKLLGCNEAAARILGYGSTEEALSHSLWDFYDDPTERQGIVQRLVEERAISNLEARCRSKQGDVVWVLANVSLLNGSSGPDAVIEGTLIDITARKQAEKEVVMLAHAVRSIQESVTITDNDGLLLFVNDAFLKTYGYDREEVIGKDISDLVRVRSGSPNSPGVLPPKHLSSRWEGDLFNRRKDGTEFPIHLSASPIWNDAGEPVALVGVSQDITAQRYAMVELQSAKEVAEAASRAKSEFLANMSHEIRTPMNGIIGMTDLALDTELTSEQREYLKMVKQSADSLLGVINDVLDFSKIEAGKLELDPAEFNLQDAVDEVLKTLSVRAEQKGLELAYYLRPGVPERVIGDVGRLRQVLVNLVGNAIKFTQHGEVIVRVEADARTSDEVVLHFGIRDTGIGVPPEKQSVIFESFTQADGSTTRKYGGTGLGLTISSQLVHMMDGEIWVESPVILSTGHCTPGSLFHFTGTFGLPFGSGSPAHLPEMFDLAGLPVLVVDDNATNRKILEVQLESWQMKPTLVGGGRSALHAIKQAASAGAPFKLALLDFHMPEMDGVELCEEIRKLPASRNLRIIMMSSSVHANKDRSPDCRIDASLLKPVKAAELLSVIRGVLGAKANSQTPATKAGRKSAYPSHILVAEDSAVNQELIRRLLEKWGHTAVLADDGLKALSLFDSERFDLVLMDLQMPEVNGFEVTAAIREREQNGRTRVPIIALTAHALKGDRERCIDAGMDDYISKPIDSEKLFEVLETVAGQRENSLGTSETGAQVLDLDGLLRNFDGDAEIVVMLAKIFEDSSLGQMQQIADALACGDREALARGAHSVKGAVSNFGARAAVDAAVRLEGLAKSEDLSLAGAAFGALQKEIARLKLELKMLEQASLI